MVGSPLPGGHPLHRKAHQRQPDPGPEIRRTGPHRSILLARRQDLGQAFPELPHRLAAPVVQFHVVARPEQHPHQRRVLVRRPHQPAGNPPQPLRGSDPLLALALPHHPDGPPLRLAHHLVEQRFLAGEVTVDGAFGNPGPRRDGRGGGGVVTPGGEQVERGAHQLPTGGHGVATGAASGIGHDPQG